VPAVRRYAFRGVPVPNLNWTDPDVDTGSIDPVAAPFRGAPDLTGPLTDPRFTYNSIPLLMSGIFGGGVTPTGAGTAKTWTYAPASEAPLDDDDVFTYEFGDDVLTDWYQFGDGILERVEVTGPEGLGALTSSVTWRFGSVSSTGSTDSPVTGTVPTPGLSVDPNEAIVYLKDIGIYIASDPYDLPGSQILDALHSFVWRVTQARDQKRFANASQNFDVDGYGRGARVIELEATFAKTADTVGTGSESDAWLSDDAVTRYIQFVATSTVLAQTPSTFYAWNVSMPMRYYTRTEGAVGGNTTIVLTARAFFDPETFAGVLTSAAVTTQASI
jgi:hypothetical protein